jgi:hypothetical protein
MTVFTELIDFIARTHKNMAKTFDDAIPANKAERDDLILHGSPSNARNERSTLRISAVDHDSRSAVFLATGSHLQSSS